MARRTQDFQAIRSEGGLLPPDLLLRVLDPRSKLEGTRPEDYGLPQNERLNEAITQSWSRLRHHWSEFRTAAAGLPAGEAGTGLTNDKWNLPLLRELGFGFLPAGAGREIGGRVYAISRFYGPVPIHLIGCGLSLDHRAAGQRGAASLNPHGLVQEFLNRSPECIWAILSNGLRLRILRDNEALSRQAFLEFDLETIFAGEVYSDFVLLWLMAHASRFSPREEGGPETCWLEKWAREAEEQGTRALGELRAGVEKALQILGEGLTNHPHNASLRGALRTEGLLLPDLHGQLLRIVYRLIFLFVAEDRSLEGLSLLHPVDDSDEARIARERFALYYSSTRLRKMAGKIKGSRHGDLWRQFQHLVGALSGDPASASVRKHLALPILGGFLWSRASTQALNDASLTNHDFLAAVRYLAFTPQGKILRPVDYQNLDAEELGGVYESLLSLTPQIGADGANFAFKEFSGNPRKTSGSYYTPDSLVQCLLDSALDPLVEEAIKNRKASEVPNAILGFKICDPAVGSGHFLVRAAHRLAKHLARARALEQGESEPSPPLYQHALREVIGRCVYGVDINPMAAELCRVSLWLEALEPGKPLSFLDHHIQVGNSLLGATPELIISGLPDEAFIPIEDDDKNACAVLKRRNRKERNGLGRLFVQQDAEKQALLQQAGAALEEFPDGKTEEIEAKELAFRHLVQTEEYRLKKHLADTWCSAFVIKKRFKVPGQEDSVFGITQGHINDAAAGRALPPDIASEVERLSCQFQFFHWHLAFPEVFSKGGFDCVLSNPPWEMMEAEDGTVASKEFARLQLCFRSNQYKVLKGRRDLYKLFLVNCVALPRLAGRLGLLTPLGVFIEDDASEWRRSFFNYGSVLQLRHLQNHKKRFFPEIHASYRMCAVTYSPQPTGLHSFSTVALVPEDLPSQFFVNVPRDEFDESLGTDRSAVIYPAEPYAILHRTISKSLESRPSTNFRVIAEFHSSTDRDLIKQTKPDGGWALLKNRNIHYFNYNFAPHEAWIEPGDVKERLQRKNLLSDSWFTRFPRLVFRDIARNDDERTLIGCLVPPGAVSTYDTPMFLPDCREAQYPKVIAFYGAVFSAYLFDFLIRPVVDKHLKGYTLARIRWPSIESLPLDTLGLEWFTDRMLELVYTTPDFQQFAADCGWAGPPFQFDEKRRFMLRCELDASLFHLFVLSTKEGRLGFDGNVEGELGVESVRELARLKGYFPTPHDAVEYIMDTFPIVRQTDEEKYGGDYRTKRVILEIYDAMQESLRSGQPYKTRLNPPPGDPRCCHPPRDIRSAD